MPAATDALHHWQIEPSLIALHAKDKRIKDLRSSTVGCSCGSTRSVEPGL